MLRTVVFIILLASFSLPITLCRALEAEVSGGNGEHKNSEGTESVSSSREVADDSGKTEPSAKCLKINKAFKSANVDPKDTEVVPPDKLETLANDLSESGSGSKEALVDLKKCFTLPPPVLDQLAMAFASDADIGKKLVEERKNEKTSAKARQLEAELKRRTEKDPLFRELKKRGAGNGNDLFLFNQVTAIRKAAKELNHQEANRLASGLVHSLATAKRDDLMAMLDSGLIKPVSPGNDGAISHIQAAMRMERALSSGKEPKDFRGLNVGSLKPDVAKQNMQVVFNNAKEFHEIIGNYKNATSEEDKKLILAKLKEKWGEVNPQWFATHMHIESKADSNKKLDYLTDGARAALHDHKLKEGSWAMGTTNNAWKVRDKDRPDVVHVVDTNTFENYLKKMGNPDLDGHGNPNTHFVKSKPEEVSAAKLLMSANNGNGTFNEGKITDSGDPVLTRVRIARADNNELMWDKYTMKAIPPPSVPIVENNNNQKPGPAKEKLNQAISVVTDYAKAATGRANELYDASSQEGVELETKREAVRLKQAQNQFKEEQKKEKPIDSNEVYLAKSKLNDVKSKYDTAEGRLRELKSERVTETCGSSWNPISYAYCYQRKQSLENEIGKTLDRMRDFQSKMRELRSGIANSNGTKTQLDPDRNNGLNATALEKGDWTYGSNPTQTSSNQNRQLTNLADVSVEQYKYARQGNFIHMPDADKTALTKYAMDKLGLPGDPKNYTIDGMIGGKRIRESAQVRIYPNGESTIRTNQKHFLLYPNGNIEEIWKTKK